MPKEIKKKCKNGWCRYEYYEKKDKNNRGYWITICRICGNIKEKAIENGINFYNKTIENHKKRYKIPI